ncbi:hypothetical protein BDQ12DRAFT_578972, partial [Crucibulum laeve]
EYFDPVSLIHLEYLSHVHVVAVSEPNAITNLATILNAPKCSGAQAAYKSGVTCALRQLNSVSIYMY